MKNIVFLVGLVLALSGCGHDKDRIIIEDPKSVKVDPKLLVECEPLDKLEGSSDEQTLAWIKSTGTKYAKCASNHRGVVKAINRLSGK